MPTGTCIGGPFDGAVYSRPVWRLVVPITPQPGMVDHGHYHVYVWSTAVKLTCPHTTTKADHWCYQSAVTKLPT